jgi:nicotinate-nucleotide adenylyltransferase
LLQKKRIGLFGGTFDPVHLGHTIVAEWLQFKLDLIEIHFIPNYAHPFSKRDNISAPEHRLKMLELALSEFPAFKICKHEIDKKEISYSIDTIRYFTEQYPDYKLYYLIGGDNIDEFHLWKNSDDIFKLATVIVYDRIGRIDDKPIKFQFIDSPLIEISSSQIREHVKKGYPYRSFLHPDVYHYIKQKKLYKAA